VERDDMCENFAEGAEGVLREGRPAGQMSLSMPLLLLSLLGWP
jgi:hypothetical protein